MQSRSSMEERREDDSTPSFWSRSNRTNSYSPSSSSSSSSSSSGTRPWVLVLLASIFVILFIPSFLRGFRTRLVKSGWDTLNLALVIFAILCGLLGRDISGNGPPTAREDDEKLPSRTPRSREWVRNAPAAEEMSFESNLSMGIRRMRSSSSYPDLRQEFSTGNGWGIGSSWRFSDDVQIYRDRRGDLRNLDSSGKSTAKTIGVDTFELVRTTSSSRSPPPTPPRTTARKLPVNKSDKNMTEKFKAEKPHSPPNVELPPPSPPPPPPPPPPPRLSASDPKKGHKRRSSATAKDLATAIALFYNKKKRKNKEKKIHDDDTVTTAPSSSSTPTPPPPPPPPSVFSQIFSQKKGATKTKRSSTTPFQQIPAPPPPPPPPPPTVSHSTTKEKSPVPPSSGPRPQRKKKEKKPNILYTYPIAPPSPLPPPPPPPPPPMPGDEEPGDSKTVVEGDTPAFFPSPDVNNKADVFIERFRAGLKLERLNSILETQRRKQDQAQGRQQQAEVDAELEQEIMMMMMMGLSDPSEA